MSDLREAFENFDFLLPMGQTLNIKGVEVYTSDVHAAVYDIAKAVLEEVSRVATMRDTDITWPEVKAKVEAELAKRGDLLKELKAPA
jgi:hypothetical protein